MDQSALEIKKYIDQLPPAIKTAVLGAEWNKRIGEIGQKYSLHLDQISSLEYEVLFVMIGMEPEEDLVENIQKELSISKILATQLAEEINIRIFQYILKTMQAQSAPKPERFEQKLGARSEKLESKKIDVPKVYPWGTAQQSHSNIKLLSEMENMAGKSNNEIRSTSYEGEKTEKPIESQQKIAEPPANLPGEVILDRSKLQDAGTRNSAGDIPIPESRDLKPETASFVENKLSNIVKSENEIVAGKVVPLASTDAIQAENPIQKSYVVDPYREPLE